MNSIFLGITVFLFVLAVFDLIVGVSNDAVNFLNSAVGAKIASFRTIIIVAAVGIFFGAALSNGMLEVARNGIFRPEMFSFMDLMFILTAVMVSDIILLDIFNNLGLPTSTTVSMVFELLGGTFALSLIKITQDTTGTLEFSQLMNTGKALTIIVSIFMSVAIAFFFGSLIQFISRSIFTFTYKNKLKYKIGIFGGIAATCIVYFMLIKGLKNLSFMTPEYMAWIHNNSIKIIAGCFVIFTIITQILYWLKVNVFKILVLMGTLALAMAFASNDLVNFIGVPLAGYSSYTDFIANGNGNAAGYMMKSLSEPANTPVYFLLGAGIIMVIALATSKKAKNVVKTSVELARQGDGDEMFGSSKVARVIVRLGTNMAHSIADIVPLKVREAIDKRFCRDHVINENGAAFDELRATINLIVASLLIALGTSFKLPLSTTYVTFMVAMGTSLADRAWGRESAVFRVTGVLSVIAGWFITAGAAFILCFIVALIIKFGGPIMAIVVVCIGIFILIRSNIKYRNKNKEEKGDVVYNDMVSCSDKKKTFEYLTQHVAQSQVDFLYFANNTYKELTDGFINEELGKLAKTSEKIRNQRVILKNTRRKEMIGMRLIEPAMAMEKNTSFHMIINSCEDALFCLRRISDSCLEHIDNTFVPLSEDMIKEFLPLRDTVLFLIMRIHTVIEKGYYDELADVYKQIDDFGVCMKQACDKQINRMQTSKDNITMSYVYLNVLQESEEFVVSLRHLVRAVRTFAPVIKRPEALTE